MKLKRFILDIVLTFLYYLTLLIPIDDNKIAFVSLEANELKDDMLLIYEALGDRYKKVCVLTTFKKNNLWSNFIYFLNTLKQIFVINTSKLVIINDNNYCISNFKRDGVKVIQVWHAAGAIKKFGNAIKREYKIDGYDYVIANGKYWIKPYSEAFNVEEEMVKTIGMPRLDHLLDDQYITKSKRSMYDKYPFLNNKKVILYAPTFRGDIYSGIKKADIDLNYLKELLGEEYVILYRLHPLLNNEVLKVNKEGIYDFNSEDLHETLCISDILISDYSSIIFDNALLNKACIAYVSDYDSYKDDRGFFIDFNESFKDNIAKNEKELASLIINDVYNNAKNIRDKYLESCDGNSLDRNVKFIDEIMKS